MHRASYPPIITERFWAKVHKTDGCWLWTRIDHTRRLRPIQTREAEYDVADHAPEEVVLLRAAFAGLEGALGCDAHVEEVAEAWKWAERVETSAWALKNKLDALRGRA